MISSLYLNKCQREIISGPNSLRTQSITPGFDPRGIRVDDPASAISSATPQWLLARALGTGLHYNQALGAMGEGPKSEPLILEVEPFRPSAPARKVSLERQPVRPTLETRPQPISEVDPRLFYVDVTRAKDDDFKAILSRMEKARGLI